VEGMLHTGTGADGAPRAMGSQEKPAPGDLVRCHAIPRISKPPSSLPPSLFPTLVPPHSGIFFEGRRRRRRRRGCALVNDGSCLTSPGDPRRWAHEPPGVVPQARRSDPEQAWCLSARRDAQVSICPTPRIPPATTEHKSPSNSSFLSCHPSIVFRTIASWGDRV
jgi:hypothetical protein